MKVFSVKAIDMKTINIFFMLFFCFCDITAETAKRYNVITYGLTIGECVQFNFLQFHFKLCDAYIVLFELNFLHEHWNLATF